MDPLETKAFRQRVAAITAGDRWVIDGNYSHVRDLVRARADTVIFLDLPRHVVMRQLTTRTLRRTVTREELWNGNREDPANLRSLDPERNILLWSFTTHASRRAEALVAACDPTLADKRILHLRTRRQVHDTIARLSNR